MLDQGLTCFETDIKFIQLRAITSLFFLSIYGRCLGFVTNLWTQKTASPIKGGHIDSSKTDTFSLVLTANDPHYHVYVVD